MDSNGRRLLYLIFCVSCASGVQGFLFDPEKMVSGVKEFVSEEKGYLPGLVDKGLDKPTCTKRLTTATISQDTHIANSSILHTVKLPGPKLVHKVGVVLDGCPEGHAYELALIDLQYVDATDVTRTKRNYSMDMIGKKNSNTSMLEYVITKPLYTDSLYITTHSSLQCSTIVPLGCSSADVCSQTHCSNGGTCIGEGICACAKGFMGNNCEKTLADLPVDDFSPQYVRDDGMLITNNGDFQTYGQFHLLHSKKRTISRICHMLGMGARFLLQHTHSMLNHNGGNSHYTHAYSTSPSSVFGSHHSSGFTQSCNVQFNNNHDHNHQVYFYNTHQNCNPHNAGSSFMYQNNALHMNVNNGNMRYTTQVPWTPTPNYVHQVSSTYSPQYGTSIYVDGQHMCSGNRPEPHYTNTSPGRYCYGSCAYSNAHAPNVPNANYMFAHSHIAGMCVPQLANNGLLPICGLSSIQPPAPQLTTPQPTTATPITTTEVFSATGVHYTAASRSGGGPMCYSCTHSSKDGNCQTLKQCNAGDVCALFHDPSGYTHSCLPKDICHKAKSMTTSDCWICCDYSLCNKQCGTAVTCDDTSSCTILRSTGYDVCSDAKAAKNECKKSCGYCGSRITK